MTGFELPPELGNLEQQLAGLKPARHQIDSDAVLFEAGRQSVLCDMDRAWNRRLTYSMTVAFSLFGALTGAAATIMIVTLTGWSIQTSAPKVAENPSASNPILNAYNLDDLGSIPTDESLDIDRSGVARTSAIRRFNIDSDIDFENASTMLSTTGFAKTGASGMERNRTITEFPKYSDDEDYGSGSSYWHLMRQELRNMAL